MLSAINFSYIMIYFVYLLHFGYRYYVRNAVPWIVSSYLLITDIFKDLHIICYNLLENIHLFSSIEKNKCWFINHYHLKIYENILHLYNVRNAVFNAFAIFLLLKYHCQNLAHYLVWTKCTIFYLLWTIYKIYIYFHRML